MIRFRMLGTLDLRDSQGRVIPAVLRRPKLVALFAHLATARPSGFHRRDSLVALLWPELDRAHARNALRQAVHALRRSLGADVLSSRGEDELAVDEERLWCDVRAFDDAISDGRREEAMELYRGPLLDGFFLSNVPDFERWLDDERAHLRRRAIEVVQQLIEREDSLGNAHGVVRWASRLSELSPENETAIRRMMRTLDQAGDRAGSVHAYEEFRRRLARDLELSPSVETRRLAETIRMDPPLEAASGRSVAVAQPEPGRSAEPALEPGAASKVAWVTGRASTTSRSPRRTAVFFVVAVLAMAAATSMALWAASERSTPSYVRESAAIDPDALELYRQGQVLLNEFTEGPLRRSIYHFNEAIARDSSFALPHVGLARAYQELGVAHGSLDPREAFPMVKRFALSALALDSNLAEAHALLGRYELLFGWNWKEAERRLREAVRLDPDNAVALQSLAFSLIILGRYDEMPALHARAIAASPHNPLVWSEAGSHHMLAGRFDDALEFLNKGLELAPNYHALLLVAGLLHAEMGDLDRAVDYLERADSISGHQEIIRGRLGYVHALAGDSARARVILAELKGRADTMHQPAKTASAIAVVHIGLAEVDSAFAWLDVAHERRSAHLIRLVRTPAAWRLAGDPRYAALLERLELSVGVTAPYPPPAGRVAR